MNAPDESTTSRFHALKGTVKRSLGWLTADRKVEAEGAAEERLESEPSEAEVKQEKQDIKEEYGETMSPPVDGSPLR